MSCSTGNTSDLNPCLPLHWHRFTVDYRFGAAHYIIKVENPERVNQGIQRIFLDGNPFLGKLIPLVDDGQDHSVHVWMGAD